MSHLECPQLILTLVKLCFVSGVSYLTMTWVINKLDPTNTAQKRISQSKGKSQLEKIGKSNLKLSEHELLISSNLIAPTDIDVTFDDIAGLTEVVKEIYETVIFPIKNRRYLKSKLSAPPKGVLLHGPPGCGKTLIAKATVKEAGVAYLSLDISIMTDKWYGESQKMVAALFSLAEKLQPCVVFIDEIDSFLRNRSSNDHEATAMMKAQFMALWDGLQTDSDSCIVIMGATNRPKDLDPAILRRMPAVFHIPKPNRAARCAILKLMLRDENTDEIDCDDLSEETEGFSSSALQEMCRTASSYRVRECAQQFEIKQDNDRLTTESINLRPITMQDMVRALDSIHSSEIV